MANNLWWSWHPEVVNYFAISTRFAGDNWTTTRSPCLAEFTPERLEMRASELVLYSRINHAFRRLKEYMSQRTSLGHARMPACWGAKPVAYFSAEFGIHESVPIYSGGLGVLSGDHVKSASDLSVPFVAIGLFYDQGYFKQHLDSNGYQAEEYIDTKVENLPMGPAVEPDGKPISVQHRHPHRPAAGQGVADARRPRATCICSIATSRAIAPRTAS